MVSGTRDSQGDIVTYPCPLDETVQVIEVPFGPEAETLAMIVMNEEVGAGVILFNSLSGLDNDHKLAVFAHELGHLARGEEEERAERWAIERLLELGHRRSASLLINRGIVDYEW